MAATGTKRAFPFEDNTCSTSAFQFAKNVGIDPQVSRLALVCEDCTHADWPSTTTTKALCIRCLQPFEGVPWPYPISYLSRERRYLCLGFLCNKHCAKAYVREKSRTAFDGNRHQQERWLAAIAREHYGVDNWLEVEAAPPLPLLCKLYGQHISALTQATGEPVSAANAMVTEAMAATMRDYRNCAPCSVLPLPFVRATFFMEMALRDEREDRRRKENAARIRNYQPAALDNSRGGQEVLKRRNNRSLAPIINPPIATVPAILAPPTAPTVATAEKNNSIANLLSMKRVRK
jgi:hypothetical protein